jgi:transposase
MKTAFDERKNKFPGRKPGSTTIKAEERAAILAEVAEGKSPEEIGKKHERSAATVVQMARKVGYGFQNGVLVKKSGAKKSGAKKAGVKKAGVKKAGVKAKSASKSGRPTTEEERKGIIADYKSGTLISQLAAKYGRNKSTIFGLLARSGVAKRGHAGALKNTLSRVTSSKKTSSRKKKSKGARVAAMVNHASEALRRVDSGMRPNGGARLNGASGDAIKRAVVSLMKTLEPEDGIQQLFIDFDKRRFQVVRHVVEERGL